MGVARSERTQASITRQRDVRKRALQEHLSAMGHYQYFFDCVHVMHQLSEGEIDQEAKDRFSMLSVIADKHWKVVERYLPPPTTTTAPQTGSSTPSALQAAVLALVQRTTSSNTAIVPTNMVHEHGVHSDAQASSDTPADT